MTTQIIYKQELELNPPLPNYYSDDSTFSHLFVIPAEYHTLNIGTTNAITKSLIDINAVLRESNA
jgi:hypothetical protein